MPTTQTSFKLILSILLIIGAAYCNYTPVFPDTFAWGVAAASYQIEGAWNASDKGLSIWDVFSHIPNTTANNDTGDLADDFYNRYHEDIQMMADLGVKHFRMSFSWPRLLPNGIVNLTDMSGSSKDGIAFYNNVLDALANASITPWVTLYHWDLPAVFNATSSTGGWLNPDIVGYFRDYAEFCFITFGDKVKHWLTFNEIATYSYIGYGSGIHAPGRCSTDDRCKTTGGGGDTTTEPYNVSHYSSTLR